MSYLRRHTVYLLGFITLALLVAFYAWEPPSDAPVTGLSQQPTGMAIVQQPHAGKQPAEPFDMHRMANDPDYYTEVMMNMPDDPEPGPAGVTPYNSFAAQNFNPLATIPVATCFTASTSGAAPGDTIELTSNIGTPGAGVDCATLDLANIVLDCKGFNISDDGTGDDGIVVTALNVTVENCIVQDFGDNALEIVGAGAAETTVYNNSFINASGEELLIDSTAGDVFNITNNFFSDHSGDSDFGENLIECDFHDQLTINDNTFGQFNNLLGSAISCGAFTATRANGATVTGNNIKGPFPNGTLDGIDFDGYNNLIVRNNFLNTTANLNINMGENITVINNSVNDTMFISGSSFFGFLDNITIAENIWRDDLDGGNFSVAAIASFDITNFRVFRHNGIDMLFNCLDFCANGTYANNTLTENGLIRASGDNIIVFNNTWNNVTPEQATSAGVDFFATLGINTSGIISNNRINNGEMHSIRAEFDHVTIHSNVIENITGQAIVALGRNISAYNNTIRNITGTGIRLVGTNKTIRNNSISFDIGLVNSTFNLDPFDSTRSGLNISPIPEGGVGVLIDGPASDNRIFRNTITVTNPLALDNGIIGILNTDNLSSNLTERAKAINHTITFNTISDALYGMYLLNASTSNISNNTITDSELTGLFLNGGTMNDIDFNTITATPTIGPSQYQYGMDLYRHDRNTLRFNTIDGYHTGLHLHNSNDNTIFNLTLSGARGYGIYSLQSTDNNITEVSTTDDVNTSISFLQSNTSIINESTFRSALTGLELYQSHTNNISDNTQLGGGTATYGLILDLFSSSNAVGDNSFAGNTIADILFDMFATGNTGAGNGGPTTASENGASGNTII